MKKNKILLIAAVACTSMFSSCSDLLDLYPEDSLSDPKFWTSVQDLELYANGFYGILPGAQGPGADDESDCYVNEKPKTWIFNLETIPTSGGGWGNGDWGNIRSCNYFMARYKQVKGDESQINRSVAVVRFFRAWEYVYKVKRFGDVPWYETELQMDSEELYKGRDSRKVVFTHILEDLDFAIEHLPKPNETKTGNMHKYAALAFKSRACLYEASFRKYHGLGDYEELYREAADAAAQVIEEGGYSIYKTDKPLQDYYNLFVQEDLASNSECIMPRVYITKLLMHNNTRQMEESYTGLSRAMFEQYLCADGLPTAVSPGYEEADMPMDELMQRDPRLRQTIDNPELPFKVLSDGTKQFNALPIIDTKYCTTGYYVMKYHSTDPEQWNIGQSTLDVFIFRYAEVLLNYAEAVYERDGKIEDTDLNISLNLVRTRVNPNMPGLTNKLVNDNGLSMREEIRRERTVELFHEGFRLDDLKRWKTAEVEMPQDILGVKWAGTDFETKWSACPYPRNSEGVIVMETGRQWQDKHYLFPLPKDQLQLNPNLKQNPGWDK